MRITRANLSVAGAASTNKKEPALNRVHLDADGSTVASDGNAFLVIGPPDPTRVQGFPDADHSDATIPDEGVGISLDAIAVARRNLPTDKRIAL